MRFLGVGESCDLGSVYHRLALDGNEVKVHIADPHCRETFDGIVDKSHDWKADLDWVGKEGIVLFESVLGGVGAVQDELRGQGYRVIGGSAFGDRLENDRAFAQAVLRDHGFNVAPHWEFEHADDALAFVRGRPRRYVLKFNGYGSMNTMVGRLADGSDIVAILRHLFHSTQQEPRIVLTPHLEGVEMGVGAYFTGTKFLRPACLDWEHKRFFPGGLGELTPEMGTVVTYERSQRFFDLTLGKLEALLREEGYQGYINLNTMVNAEGIWPLEFTCRFGYPGSAILQSLQRSSWAEIFEAVLEDGERFETRPGFSVGIVVTVPPFPYTRLQIAEPVGVPVQFSPPLNEKEIQHVHLGEVKREGSTLVTAGIYGWTMVVTSLGNSIPDAQRQAYGLLDKLVLANCRYRLDIGSGVQDADLALIEELGFLS